MTEAIACEWEIFRELKLKSKINFEFLFLREIKNFQIFFPKVIKISKLNLQMKASLAPELVLRVMDTEMYSLMISSFLPHLVNPQNQFSDHALHTKAFVDSLDSKALHEKQLNMLQALNSSNKSLTMQSTVIPTIISTIIWWWREILTIQMTAWATVLLIGCWHIWCIATTTSMQFCWFGRI